MTGKGLERILSEKGGIRLDIGCGGNKQEGFVGLDRRPLPNVDVVWDLEIFPYPLPDESCLMIIGRHIVEHIKPWLMIDFMNELWRIMKPEGQLAFVHPYSVNPLFVQDPTHCNPCNEATWQYFDHRYPLWTIYTPKPWELEKGFPQFHIEGNMEVLLKKVLKPDGTSVLDSLKGGKNESKNK